MSEIKKLSEEVGTKFIEHMELTEEIMELNKKLDDLVLIEQLKMLNEHKKKNREVA